MDKVLRAVVASAAQPNIAELSQLIGVVQQYMMRMQLSTEDRANSFEGLAMLLTMRYVEGQNIQDVKDSMRSLDESLRITLGGSRDVIRRRLSLALTSQLLHRKTLETHDLDRAIGKMDIAFKALAPGDSDLPWVAFEMSHLCSMKCLLTQRLEDADRSIFWAQKSIRLNSTPYEPGDASTQRNNIDALGKEFHMVSHFLFLFAFYGTVPVGLLQTRLL